LRGTEGALALENTSPPDSNSNRGFRDEEKNFDFLLSICLFEHCLIILSLTKLNLVKNESHHSHFCTYLW
jgi:hypothetical protein